MFKDNRVIPAGQNEIYRWGRKAEDKLRGFFKVNAAGYISIPVDGGKYWTIGTSKGKFGEFCKINDVIFSVNGAGFAYGKAGTTKGEALLSALMQMYDEMMDIRADRAKLGNNDDEE